MTVTLKQDTVIGLRIDQAISSETAKVDDKITAKVSRDVVVDGTTAIPAGTRVEGTVASVERPSKDNPRGKVGIRFTTLVRPDNTRVAIATETVVREAPGGSSGAAYDVNAFSAVVSGGRVPPRGSGSPTPAAAKPRDVQLPAGSLLSVHLTAPLSVTIVRDPQ